MKRSDIVDGKIPRRQSKDKFGLGFKLQWNFRERVVTVRSLSESFDTELMCSHLCRLAPSGVQGYRLVPAMHLAASASRLMV